MQITGLNSRDIRSAFNPLELTWNIVFAKLNANRFAQVRKGARASEAVLAHPESPGLFAVFITSRRTEANPFAIDIARYLARDTPFEIFIVASWFLV